MICRKKQNSSFCLKNMFVNFFVGKVGSMSLDVFGGWSNKMCLKTIALQKMRFIEMTG